MNTKNFNYTREDVKCGILHFGVGNFHRAHLQSYTNALLNAGGSKEWGICGAMIMSQDETLYKKLKQQDGLYTLTVCGRDGDNEVQRVGSLVDLMWIGEGVESIINRVAHPDTRIISMTITEGGYNLDTPAVRADIEEPQNPKTIFGIVAEGLRRRVANGVGKVTILTCDNLQHNGNTCRNAFTTFFYEQDLELSKWVDENVTFPNSMVDRITPATTADDVTRINRTLSQPDLAPVYCEDYLQWVVEDNFAAGRPSWEEVGVEFTDDVTPYENMKLSLLNASHTLLSYPSFLSGYRKVDAAMGDERVVKFVQDFMNIDVTPYVPAPKNTNLEEYKKILVERFANSAVSDQIARLCGDGASKFPVYVMPIVSNMLAHGDDMTRIAYLVAAYYHYVKYRTDDNGDGFDIFEPALQPSDIDKISSHDAALFLSSSPFVAVELLEYYKFVDLYLKMVKSIKEQGAMKTLESIL